MAYFYFVAVFEKLLGRDFCSIQECAVSRAEIVDVIFYYVAFRVEARDFGVLARGYFVTQHEVNLRATTDDGLLFVELDSLPDGLPLQHYEHRPLRAWASDDFPYVQFHSAL
jgi:hypothetical protein